MYKIKTNYFPLFLVYVAPPLMVIFALYIISTSPVWAALLIIVAIIMATTHYITFLDCDRREYGDYLFFLGLKLNAEYGKFRDIDKITITKETLTYNASTRSTDRSVTYRAYTAVLVFAEDHKIELLTDTEKHRLLTKIKALSMKFGIPVEDQTVGSPYFIDIAQV